MNKQVPLATGQAYIDEAIKIIAGAQSIVITAHQNPDGDALGSALGLWHVVKAINKNCVCLMPDAFPHFLAWMPGTDQIKIFDTEKEKATGLLKQAGLIFCLDYNAPERTGQAMGEVLKTAPAYKIMIDHHPHPADFCDLTINEPADCSTAQLIYRFIVTLGYQNLITANAATCLYTGIMTDTGSFRYPSTTALTHHITAKLIEAGANNGQVHINVYDTNSESKLRLTGYALTQKLTVLRQHATAYFVLTAKELADFNYQKGDTEGLVNYGLSIEGVKLAAIFMETEGLIKISFRSKGDVPVNEFMSNNFSGGGHKNAAGGRSNKSLDVTIHHFLSLIPAFMDQYK
ncbi:MAG TPA: bifunctional oligoribonuclease/PAP phosphatase NrnA [Flavobacteriales bacterium]|nr:bifunctional oligoribonuclease/PAP phosphatase NrnA [Flavobacteriales bacterium]